MAVYYSYKARNLVGKLVTGSLEAESEQDVFNQLRKLQYTPIKVTAGKTAQVSGSGEALQPVKVRPIKVRELMIFCFNLATMVNAGIPLLGALNTIVGQISNPYFADVIRKVAKMVSQGTSFSDALEKFPDAFSKFFVSMVRVAELSGTMDDVLKRLAGFMENQENLRMKIKGALIYPAILITAGTGVILLILIFVIPKFVDIFQKSGVPLPMATVIVSTIGKWLQQYWWALFLTVGALVGSFRIAVRTPLGRDLWDRFVLKMPLFGSLTREILVARFSRTLGSLLNAGVPLLQSLDILKEVVDNTVFGRIVDAVYASVEKGEGVHKPLIKQPEFSQDVVYMISVGENTGKIGEMLSKVADFYETKVENSIKGLLVFIEPVFISILGVCVGTMLAAVILPMFDMVKTMHR